MARTSKASSSAGGRGKKAKAADEPSLSIDEILDGLESVVTELEAGDLPLEDALKRFEQGVELARKGSTVLDAVEERVEELLADRDEAVPFADGE